MGCRRKQAEKNLTGTGFPDQDPVSSLIRPTKESAALQLRVVKNSRDLLPTGENGTRARETWAGFSWLNRGFQK